MFRHQGHASKGSQIVYFALHFLLCFLDLFLFEIERGLFWLKGLADVVWLFLRVGPMKIEQFLFYLFHEGEVVIVEFCFFAFEVFIVGKFPEVDICSREALCID